MVRKKIHSLCPFKNEKVELLVIYNRALCVCRSAPFGSGKLFVGLRWTEYNVFVQLVEEMMRYRHAAAGQWSNSGKYTGPVFPTKIFCEFKERRKLAPHISAEYAA